MDDKRLIMLVQKFKNHFFLELSKLYPQTEIQSFFNILIEFKLNLSRVDLALKPNFEITSQEIMFFEKALSDLKKHIPIQYITGTTNFYGLDFNVNSSVLIPRPETEELISWIIKDSKNFNKISILDIGTGSGCIAISLAKNLPNAKVYALDISKEALKIAKNNAAINKVSIEFIEADILSIEQLKQNFNIIVSNPPYVRELEKEMMQQNVLTYEPHLALFVKNENPLLFYNKIADLAKNHLVENGNLYFEINQYLGKETSELLTSKGFKNVKLKKDIFEADRMIKASLIV